MLPYTHPSCPLDSSCNFRNDEFPAPPPLLSSPNYYPFDPANLDTDDPFQNLISPAFQPEPDQESSTKKVKEMRHSKRSRTDRHSKIHTAQGLRDRRMRLSLDVARKFFGLQDLLGFEKASDTVDWLITQSRSAIEHHLIRFTKASNNDTHDASISAYSSANKNPLKKKEVSSSLHHLVAKKSRAEARARARERTKEKKRKMAVESDSGGSGQLECITDLPFDTTKKDQWPLHVEDLDCPSLNQARTLVDQRIDYESGQQNVSYCLYSNEESMNFFHEQLAGNFSADFWDQQPSLLAEVQFQSCTPCNMSPII